MDNKTKLDEVIGSEIENLITMNSGSQEKARAVEDLSKLYKLKIEDERNDCEIYDKSKRRDLDEKQAKDQAMIGKAKLVLEGLSAVGSLGLLGYSVVKGFKFEETGTIASNTMRRLLGMIKLPKK